MESPAPHRRERVVVAGAAGFVGREVVARLVRRFEVIALTQRPLSPPPAHWENFEWRACDLFSQLQLEAALKGAQYAVYLVHGQLPSARLTQGTAEDRELILAANFAQCARRAGIQQIVRVGEVVRATSEARRTHARELQATFDAEGVPVTTLRTGVILGKGGVAELVLKTAAASWFPLPAFTELPCRPVTVEQLAGLVADCVGDANAFGRDKEVGGPNVLTFRQALSQYTSRSHAKLPAILEPLWERWIARRAAIPLERLRTVTVGWRQPPVSEAHSAGSALDVEPKGAAPIFLGAVPRAPHGRDVMSIQRLPLPKGWNAERVAHEYVDWLQKFLSPWLKNERSQHGDVRIGLRRLQLPLLELTFSRERSTPSRQLFYITGGLLAFTPKDSRPRLEFREAAGGSVVLAAIHDFVPSLPWVFYRVTQALVHLRVMSKFGRYLRDQETLNQAPVRTPGATQTQGPS